MNRTNPRIETGESSFNLVYGSPAVIPAEIWMKTYKISNYDEEHNGRLLKENLELIEEKREATRIRFENYKRQIKTAYGKRV